MKNVCTSQSLVQIKLKTAFHSRGASNAVLDVCTVCTVPNKRASECVRACVYVSAFRCVLCCWFSALHGCLLDIIVDFVFRFFFGFWVIVPKTILTMVGITIALCVWRSTPRAAYTFYIASAYGYPFDVVVV